MTHTRVLLLGRDQANLEMMAVVLRHFWAVDQALLSASDRLGDPTLDALENADLAVLCDSIEEPRRQRFVEALRAHWPTLLIVKLNGYDSGPHAGADATVDTVHGPAALVSTLYELLTERGLPSKEWTTVSDPAWIQ
jgi:hypothetical protein